MRNSSRIVLAIGFLMLCACSSTPQQAEKTHEWIGPLGHPYGKIIRIEGRWVKDEEKTDYWSANIAQNLFKIDTVNGEKCDCELELVGTPLPEKDDKKHTLTGYQSGQVREDSLIAGYKYDFLMQGRKYNFTSHFVIVPPEKIIDDWKFESAYKPTN